MDTQQQAAHTPGPWRIDRASNGTFVRASHGGLVASMEAGYQAMRDADAHLIAAAPALLAALDRIGDLHGHRCSNVCATEPSCEWLQASTAIQQARGEAQ